MRILGLILASITAGAVMAVGYQLSSLRLQLWLSHRVGRNYPYVSVAAFLGRLLAIGLLFVALIRWTPANMLATGLSFVMLFTVLNAISLYRVFGGGTPAGISKQV